jgi:predicted amino acid dehydrogenase
MISHRKKILLISFSKKGPVRTEEFQFSQVPFQMIEHQIGYDFPTAQKLIEEYDGQVAGIALGLQKAASAGRTRIIQPEYLQLLRRATRTPVYDSEEIRDFFAHWLLQRVLTEQPDFFRNKRTLFHCALVSPYLQKIIGAGAQFTSADLLLLTKIPKKIHSEKELERVLKTLSFARQFFQRIGNTSAQNTQDPKVLAILKRWISETDVFITFGNLLDRFTDYSVFEGKVVVADYIRDDIRNQLTRAGVRSLIETIPEAIRKQGPFRDCPLVVYGAILDQLRLMENSLLSTEEYLLSWVQRNRVEPNRIQVRESQTRRCAFVIHPLAQQDFWKVPGFRVMKDAPLFLRDAFEGALAHAPIQPYGQIHGVRSSATGVQTTIDLYALLATPRKLLSMNESFIYGRLVDAAKMAQKHGATLIGLGAYTKVVGDAGVTVEKASPIPVTTGNSFTVSTTLWAAKEMIEKMGLVSLVPDGKRYQAKAMIIGATGSIGRVSALLVALVCKEIVLVSRHSDKLLELRDEVLAVAPGTVVRVSTNSSHDLPSCDLVVTATSNIRGNTLDIDRVKPGAVICDCSRPFDVSPEQAQRRPDVLVVESGEVLLPGNPKIEKDIGLAGNSVYACLAETALLSIDRRDESYSLSKKLSMAKVKEIYKIALKHGATLACIRGPLGPITSEVIETTRALARTRLTTWGLIGDAKVTPLRAFGEESLESQQREDEPERV